MTKSYEYELCGLRVQSCVELPAVPAGASSNTSPRVVIRYGAVPTAVEQPTIVRPVYQASRTELLLRIADVGAFWVREGEEVVVERDAASDDHDIRAFLLGTVLGALIYQRRLLPLHASAVRVAGGCVAFCGASGSGKSTSAALLAERGHALVNDDVCVISADSAGRAQVWPGYPQLKLWRDAVTAMRAEAGELQPVRRRQDKFQWPAQTGFRSEPLTPLVLYVMEARGPRMIRRRLTGLDAVRAVARCSFRDEFIFPMGLMENQFRLAAATAATADVYLFTAPDSIEGMREALDELEADWRSGSPDRRRLEPRSRRAES